MLTVQQPVCSKMNEPVLPMSLERCIAVSIEALPKKYVFGAEGFYDGLAFIMRLPQSWYIC